MKKAISFLLTFLFLAALCAKAQPPVKAGDAEASYQIGVKLLQEGRAADALPYLQAAVKSNGESYLYRLNAGRAAQFSENYQPCVDNFTEAMRLRPKEQTAQAFYLWRAECSAELGNRAAAQSDFAKAVELQPGIKWAYSYRIFYDTENRCQKTAAEKYNSAEMFYKENKIYEAYRDLYVALKCDPKHLPSLKLRLKIESADNNLAAHANVHRAALAKIENFDSKNPASASRTAANSQTASDKAALGKKLHQAVAAKDRAEALRLIQQGGADLNYEADSDSTLQAAIRNRDTEMAKALLEAGADPNFADSKYGGTALQMAVQMSNIELVELLIYKYKADVNPKNSSGYSVLHTAADFNRDEKITAILLAAGSNPNVVNTNGNTPLSIALSQGKAGIAALLQNSSRRQTAPISEVTPAGEAKRVSPANAATTPAVRSTKLLDGYLAQIDQMFAGKPVFTRGNTSRDGRLGPELYDAVKNKNTAVGLDLIKQGADVNYQGILYTGGTIKSSVLYAAAANKDLTLVKALLEAGADPNLNLPAILAIQNDNVLMLALFIKHKADIIPPYNDTNSTSLHAAAVFSTDENITALLLEAGVDKSVVDKDGKTALYFALKYYKLKVAALLSGTAVSMEDVRQIAKDEFLKEFTALKRKINDDGRSFKLVAEKIRQLETSYYLAERLREARSLVYAIIKDATHLENLAQNILAKGVSFSPQDLEAIQEIVEQARKHKADAISVKPGIEDRLRKLQGYL